MKIDIKKVVLIAAIGLLPITSNAANFAGPYAGLVIGLGMPTTIVDDYDCNITCTSWNENSKLGSTYGLEGGYNWTLSPATLVGIEADYSGTSFKGEGYSANWGTTGAGHFSKWKSLVTLRGRAGVVVDNALLYVTGGFASVDLDATGFYANSSGYNYDASGRRSGVAVGAGFEYKLASSPLSFKGEVLSVSTQGKETLAIGATRDYNKYKVTASALLFRFGANYIF